MYGFVGSSFTCEGLPQSWQAGPTLHRGARASHYRGLSLPSTGSRRAGSVAVAHGPSRSAACGILPDQGSNPHPPHWQADSQPLRHQGSPKHGFTQVKCAFYKYGTLPGKRPQVCCGSRCLPACQAARWGPKPTTLCGRGKTQ